MPPRDPLVSLVMPAWRPDPRWLREAVESALSQEGCEVELVVVDDGSPEPVAASLEDVTDPRLRLLRVEHGGVSRARNAGLAAAQGEFIRFLDADDVIPPRSTAALLAATSPSIGIAYGATLVCDEALQPLRTMKCDLEGDILESCLLGRLDITLPSILFDRRVVEAAGPWNEALTLCEDYDFVLRAVAHTSVRAVGEIATWYRRHGASATRTADLATAETAWRTVIEGFFRAPSGSRGIAPPAPRGGGPAPRPRAGLRPFGPAPEGAEPPAERGPEVSPGRGPHVRRDLPPRHLRALEGVVDFIP